MLVSAILTLTKDSLTLLALLGYLFYLNWHLTLIVLTLFPGLILIMRVLSRRLYKLTRASQHATDELALRGGRKRTGPPHGASARGAGAPDPPF